MPDLHAEWQRTQRLRKDRQKQSVSLRLQQLSHTAFRQPCEQLKRPLRRLTSHLVRGRQLRDQNAHKPPQMRRRLVVHFRRAARRLVRIVLRRLACVCLLQHMVQRRTDPFNVARRITRHVLQHIQQRTHNLQLVVSDPVRAERRASHECVDADPPTEPPVPVVFVAARAERRRKGMHHGVAQTRARCRHMLTVVEELAHDRQEDLEMRCIAVHVDAID